MSRFPIFKGQISLCFCIEDYCLHYVSLRVKENYELDTMKKNRMQKIIKTLNFLLPLYFFLHHQQLKSLLSAISNMTGLMAIPVVILIPPVFSIYIELLELYT